MLRLIKKDLSNTSLGFFIIELSLFLFEIEGRSENSININLKNKNKKMITSVIVLSFAILIYGVIAFFVNKYAQAEDGKRYKLPLPIVSMFLGLASLVLFSIITVVGPQEVGVVVTPGGVKEKELTTGWHVIAPWNSVNLMDKTVWVYTFSSQKEDGQNLGDDAIWAPTKDGIKVGLDISVSWRIDPPFAPWIYSNVSEDEGGDTGRYRWLEENVIRPKTKSATALAMSQFTPIEAYSNKREEIKNLIFNMLSKELGTYHLILDQVDMREVFYNPEYEKAINAKKLAEQEVLRLVEVTRQKEEQLKQAEIDKNISIQKAEGEAKALQIKGSSIAANPKIISLEWIDKWDGKLPQYMLGGGEKMILNMPQ
jgi:regulator of protease activity HflC (stomatin/prohibitin superfamily)